MISDRHVPPFTRRAPGPHDREADRMNDERHVSIADGEIHAWIEQGASIHLKAVTREGDPVELSVGEAKRLAHALLALASRLETAGS